MLPNTKFPFFKRIVAVFRPRCHALITPTHVVLDVGGKSRPFVHHRRNEATATVHDFSAAVTDLMQLLDKAGIEGTRLYVVVSDYWASTAILPTDGININDEEVEKLLFRHYSKLHGDDVLDWRWCWDQSDKHLVAVAWPENGLTTLKSELEKRNCSLTSAKPTGLEVLSALSDLANLANMQWLLVVTKGCTTLLRLKNDELIDWRVFTCATEWPDDIALQLSREIVIRPDIHRDITVVNLDKLTDHLPLKKSLSSAGWNVRTMPVEQLKQSKALRLSQMIVN